MLYPFQASLGAKQRAMKCSTADSLNFCAGAPLVVPNHPPYATAPRAAVHDGRPRSLRVRPRAADWRTQEQRLARPNAHLHSACFTLYIHKATITGVFFAVFLSTAAVWCVPFGLYCSVPSVPSCLLQVSPNSNNNSYLNS